MAVRRATSGRPYQCPTCGAVGRGYDCTVCVERRRQSAKFARRPRPARELLELLTDEPRRK